MNEQVSKAQLFASLPPPWPTDLRLAIRETAETFAAKFVVLDDDPTGTQTVYDVPVLTSWGVEELSTELAEVSGRMRRRASLPQHSPSLPNP